MHCVCTRKTWRLHLQTANHDNAFECHMFLHCHYTTNPYAHIILYAAYPLDNNTSFCRMITKINLLDCTNQLLRQPTKDSSVLGKMPHLDCQSMARLGKGWQPWHAKGMLSHCNPLLLSTPLQLTATLGLQPHLTYVSAGVMQNLNTNGVQFITAHLHWKVSSIRSLFFLMCTGLQLSWIHSRSSLLSSDKSFS